MNKSYWHAREMKHTLGTSIDQFRPLILVFLCLAVQMREFSSITEVG